MSINCIYAYYAKIYVKIIPERLFLKYFLYWNYGNIKCKYSNNTTIYKASLEIPHLCKYSNGIAMLARTRFSVCPLPFFMIFLHVQHRQFYIFS